MGGGFARRWVRLAATLGAIGFIAGCQSTGGGAAGGDGAIARGLYSELNGRTVQVVAWLSKSEDELSVVRCAAAAFEGEGASHFSMGEVRTVVTRRNGQRVDGSVQLHFGQAPAAAIPISGAAASCARAGLSPEGAFQPMPAGGPAPAGRAGTRFTVVYPADGGAPTMRGRQSAVFDAMAHAERRVGASGNYGVLR